MPVALTSFFFLITLLGGCGGDGNRCGPSSATVTRIVDGDTVELEDKTKVRYLMIDTPESTGGADDCYGQESTGYNRDLVLDRKVKLTYDVECTDFFDRLLAYVEVDGTEVNLRMVEYGYACSLYIPPNGEDRRAEFENLEAAARAADRGMWGACNVVTCDQ
ncbi:thermonuclease family protein [Myxococcota bacterium]